MHIYCNVNIKKKLTMNQRQPLSIATPSVQHDMPYGLIVITLKALRYDFIKNFDEVCN